MNAIKALEAIEASDTSDGDAVDLRFPLVPLVQVLLAPQRHVGGLSG